MNVTKRNLWHMAFFMLITLGIYSIYWLVSTKLELNRLGAKIPTAWLIIIPFANIYFFYKFAEGFCTVILNNKSQTVAYFLLLLLTFPIGEFIFQHQMNEVV